MCLGAPKVEVPDPPVIPERQAIKPPREAGGGNRADLAAKRRRGLSRMILTGPSGILGIPSTGALGGGSG